MIDLLAMYNLERNPFKCDHLLAVKCLTFKELIRSLATQSLQRLSSIVKG